ncbi:hypothetical protein CRYUN_Cryun12cG0026000 [Craigia yunnanensis]
MDETAVSSDAVTALLLDEKVVKDWFKRTFKNIITEFQGICILKNLEKCFESYAILVFVYTIVLEVLESSFKGRLLAQLHNLHHLQESILKTKQHLEITIWCVKHQFLEHVRSRHANFTSWHNLVRERRSAATMRAWPDAVDHSADSTRQDGSLFIEDALANLDIEHACDQETGEESNFAFFQNGALSFFRSKIEGMTGVIHLKVFELLWTSSFYVVVLIWWLQSKQLPEEEWRHIMDDFAASFGISRHSLLESFTFCLLDDHTDEALLESYQLLPEISGPATHPKITQVLLERQNPEAAQMALRWSGHDGGSQLVLLSEAVTVIRVKVERGHLTEAFTYQQMLCTKVREKKFKYGPSGNAYDDLEGQCRSWLDWIEVLVTEFCCLCIRRNLVDRIIEFPWNSDEEKYIHKSLLDFAAVDPSTAIGSLLVVFYLQICNAWNGVTFRFGSMGAINMSRHIKLILNFGAWSKTSFQMILSMEKFYPEWNHNARGKGENNWLQVVSTLRDKGIELLPEVLQQRVKTGILSDIVVASGQEDEMPAISGLPELQEPKSGSLLAPFTYGSVVLQPDHMATTLRPSVFEMPKILGGYVNHTHVEAGNYGSSSILHGRLFADAERVSNVKGGKNFKSEGISSPGVCSVSPIYATPLKGISRSSSRELPSRHLQGKQSDKIKIISEGEQNGFVNTSPPYSRRVTANPVSTPSSNYDLFKGSANNLHSNISGKRGLSDRDDGYWNVLPIEDLMDVSWSHGERPFEDRNANGGLRWRSDETSDDEEHSPDRTVDVGAIPMRGHRRRFARR